MASLSLAGVSSYLDYAVSFATSELADLASQLSYMTHHSSGFVALESGLYELDQLIESKFFEDLSYTPSGRYCDIFDHTVGISDYAFINGDGLGFYGDEPTLTHGEGSIWIRSTVAEDNTLAQSTSIANSSTGSVKSSTQTSAITTKQSSTSASKAFGNVITNSFGISMGVAGLVLALL